MTEENDAIIDFLLDRRESLTKPQKAKLDRLYFCCDLIHKYGSKQKVLRMMYSRYKEEYSTRGKGYSRKTASRDFDAAQYVFGATANHSKEFHIEILLEKVFETIRMAVLTNNATAKARAESNYIAIIEKFFGDKDTPDYSKLQLPVQIFSADPELLNLEPAKIEKIEREMAKLVGKPLEGLEMARIEEAEVVDG